MIKLFISEITFLFFKNKNKYKYVIICANI